MTVGIDAAAKDEDRDFSFNASEGLASRRETSAGK